MYVEEVTIERERTKIIQTKETFKYYSTLNIQRTIW